MFSLIIISNPVMLPNEAAIIHQLFDEGLELFHLRKPDADEQAVRQLIEAIPAVYRDRIVMHGFFHLMEEYGMHRLHLREEHRQKLEREGSLFKGSSPWQMKQRTSPLSEEDPPKRIFSTSVHDLQTLQQLPSLFAYAFFSPVFDSISKQQYKGVVPDDFCLTDEQKPVPVIALGGIDVGNIEKVDEMNLDGAAVLGTLWNEPAKAIDIYKELRYYEDIIILNRAFRHRR
jgi:thiamine-phosphate pyrophosphorylase